MQNAVHNECNRQQARVQGTSWHDEICGSRKARLLPGYKQKIFRYFVTQTQEEAF